MIPIQEMCVYTVLKEKNSGEKFVFMNTHFGFGDKGQIGSAKLIYEYYQKISEYPTFIVGDFNMTPESPGYAAMTEKFTDVNAVTANDLKSTYHAYNPESIKNQHIDYCFVNDKVTPLTRELIDRSFDGKYPSDHFGIYMELEI